MSGVIFEITYQILKKQTVDNRNLKERKSAYWHYKKKKKHHNRKKKKYGYRRTLIFSCSQMTKLNFSREKSDPNGSEADGTNYSTIFCIKN